MNTTLVTGGAGFIGANFVHHLFERVDTRIVVLDKLTYAGHLENLADLNGNPRFIFCRTDICDVGAVREVFRRFEPTWVINFAAESHVDRSIDDPAAFIDTNLVGVYKLLEIARQHYGHLDSHGRRVFRFLQVSTDEVYGDAGDGVAFTESSVYAPNSPYSATKAGADHLVRAYFMTYGLPTILTNCSNNYGPYQHPEKLIPLMILNALDGRALPVYGDGTNVRDWVHVEDHCAGILLALQRGAPGERYHIGGSNEQTNIAIIDQICALLEARFPARASSALRACGLSSYLELKKFVPDRPGHDRRYAINAEKAKAVLGWMPKHTLASGIAQTVDWYLSNRAWCEAVTATGEDRQRRGLAASS